MKIPKSLKVHLAAGEDTPTLHLDVVRIVGGRAVATDGTIVASAPFGPGGLRSDPDEEIVDGAAISTKAWAEATRGTRGEGSIEMRFGGQLTQSSPASPATLHLPPVRPPGSEIPPAAAALAEASRLATSPGCVEITLDAERLHRLSQALGVVDGQGVRLRFNIDELLRCSSEMVLVEPENSTGALAARGLILPIRTEGRS